MSKRKQSARSKRRESTDAKLNRSTGNSDSAKPSRFARGIGISVSLAGLAALATLPFLLDDVEAEKRLAERRAAREATRSSDIDPMAAADDPENMMARETRFFQAGNLTMIWDPMKPDIRARVQPVSKQSNVTPADYVGPQACTDCHQENHADWSQSSHRWMNALANDQSVLGDFSGESKIEYRGGVGTFYRRDGKYMMRYVREDVTKLYEIHQTIGSRFYQYYVGVGLEGPEPKDHDFYKEDHVLPFGYWIERQAWVPIVHVSEELPEGERWEPIETVKPVAKSEGVEQVGTSRGVVDHSMQMGLVYRQACNYCHTTFSLADMFVRMPKQIGPSMTEPRVFDLSQFVAEQYPGIWDGKTAPQLFPSQDLTAMTGTFMGFDARDKAATLGVSCEACHLGCKEHAENKDKAPAFSPQSPRLYGYDDPHAIDTGRNAININSACARCHAGNRPKYASGISTWNSTEFSDAIHGSCYSEMSCIDCHDPHKSIGKKWVKTPAQDDASCIRCHDKYNDASTRLTHTRHTAGSRGDRCMNCHMPHINEGMQDVVRTHTIFSPTQPEMLEQNQPNACNLCHLDKSIDWTISYLQQWYGRSVDQKELDQNYADRTQAVGIGWLNQEHEATRLVATEAFAREGARWGLKHLVEGLDDEYLLNRQFTQTAIERLIGKQLNNEFGYWYYMTPEERQTVLKKIKDELLR